jgi:hypothetical protein
MHYHTYNKSAANPINSNTVVLFSKDNPSNIIDKGGLTSGGDIHEEYKSGRDLHGTDF